MERRGIFCFFCVGGRLFFLRSRGVLSRCTGALIVVRAGDKYSGALDKSGHVLNRACVNIRASTMVRVDRFLYLTCHTGE